MTQQSEDAAFRIRCVDPQATRDFGATFAPFLVPGDIVILTGELGAGKTTFVKGVVDALGGEVEATSPTFVLCHLYETTPPIAHIDCWRLEETTEVIDLALEEILDEGGVALIEWGEIAAQHIGGDVLRLSFRIDERDGDTRDTSSVPRVIECDATGESWRGRFEALRTTLERANAGRTQ